MSITDRIECQADSEDPLTQFLLDYEMQRLAFVRVINFIKAMP
jgi:hypothetical protein